MSKSYRKNPSVKNVGWADKSDGDVNKKIRGAARAALRNYDPEYDDDTLFELKCESRQYSVAESKTYIIKEDKPRWDRGPDKRIVNDDLA